MKTTKVRTLGERNETSIRTGFLVSPYMKKNKAEGIAAGKEKMLAALEAALNIPRMRISDKEIHHILRASGCWPKENIINNYLDGTSVADEDDTDSLAQEAFLLGLVDQSQVNDRFHYWWERGIELELLDAEAQLEALEERLSEMEAKGARWRAWLRKKGTPEAKKAFDKFIRDYKSLRRDYQDNCRAVDLQFDEEELMARLPTEGEAMEAYLKETIGKTPVGVLPVIMECLEEMFQAKKLTWYYYLTCGLAVAGRLYKATCKCPRKDSGWKELYEQLLHQKQQHFMELKAPGDDDRTHGSAGLSYERIDDLMDIEAVAEHHGLTPQEVLLSWDDQDQAEIEGVEGSLWESMVAKAIWG